jgi:enoyl-CoA hydratase/carnithine racemase
MNFTTLNTQQQDNTLFVTINNPPVNLFTSVMIDEVMELCRILNEKSNEIQVVMVDSADPDFWIAHFDVNDIGEPRDIGRPIHQEAAESGHFFNELQTLALSWEALPQLTIAKIDGRCRGGGLEWLLSFDMRFATESSLFSQPESEADFLACGGGASKTLMLAGHARGMEILLSARDYSAQEYERYGLINRALSKDEIDAYLDDLLDTLSYRSQDVINMHKAVSKAVSGESTSHRIAGLVAEMAGLQLGLQTGAIQRAIAPMIASGQKREVELDLIATIRSFRNSAPSTDKP